MQFFPGTLGQAASSQNTQSLNPNPKTVNSEPSVAHPIYLKLALNPHPSPQLHRARRAVFREKIQAIYFPENLATVFRPRNPKA